ncbi:MAG: MFS transporter [Hyphomonas sp.]
MTDGLHAARQRLPARLAAGYASGDMGLNVFWQGISLFLFFFYTDVMGLSPAAAGITIFIASIWDAVTDPVMGGIADRTRTPIGRYRPYLLFGAPLLAVSFCLVFYVPAGLTAGMLFVYALATHLVMRTVYTLVSIPYSSLSARITHDSRHRASLAGWRMQAAALGGITTAFATPLIVRQMSVFSGGDGQSGWFLSAAALGAVGMMIILFCGLIVREPPEPGKAPTRPPRAGILSDLQLAVIILRRNGALVRVFIAIIMASLCLAMMGKMLVYWFKYAVQEERASALALAIAPLVLLVLAPGWAWLANRISKRKAFLAGCVIALCGYSLFFLLPMTSPGLVWAVLVLIAVGGSAFAVMYWAMLPDTVEFDEALAGARHEAVIFGFAAFAQKAALGLNALLLGFLLDLIGFVPNTDQSAATLTGMKMVMTLIPILGILVTMAALRRYPIDAAFHQDLVNRIAARRAGAGPASGTGQGA